ncbi:hypothetical protein AYWB_451 [Aster yellows witches'-broom phytoplasma AYWB]|uniref:Uncharacterized protein n=1 Tax=Aster yellows witches'-broom phytoplasma (strain AYWB) TaxID=322098 RepID=Q2NJ25_AYWBP|nr:hypothetical protein AYWB_451 [Aster yellows witches'-broom phytoplasma AYWB]
MWKIGFEKVIFYKDPKKAIFKTIIQCIKLKKTKEKKQAYEFFIFSKRKRF